MDRSWSEAPITSEWGKNTQFSKRLQTIEHILINIKLFLALLRFDSKEKIEGSLGQSFYGLLVDEFEHNFSNLFMLFG